MRLDGDGQHDPAELPKLLAPLEAGEADIVTGSRFVDGDAAYRPPLARRVGIVFFARLVSLLTRQRVTDTTSGFQALNRRGIALFAEDYPSDYPEVEATLLVLKHRLRLVEVQVRMREREHGTSSITFVRSMYYMLKVTLGAVRRHVPQVHAPRRHEDEGRAPMTPVRISIAAAIASIVLILVVLELIRGRRLKERYALLWLVTGVVLLVLSLWREGLNTIAGWLGVSGYPPAILFAAATLFIIVVLLHYSTVLSELYDRNVVLAQRLALLEERLQALSTGSPPTAQVLGRYRGERERRRVDDLRDDVQRPPFRLVVDPAHVLADHPQADQLRASDQQEDHDHGRPAFDGVVGERHACRACSRGRPRRSRRGRSRSTRQPAAEPRRTT